MQVQKRKRKSEKKYCKNTREKSKGRENYLQALREVRCENSNTRGVLNFRTKG